MRIQISDHQNKAAGLRKALLSAGHELVDSMPDVLLIDHDAPVAHYPRVIERAYSEGAQVYLYSHGAPVIVSWDGIWQPSNYISGYLAQSPGQKRVMEAYGYPHPVHVIGWHFCEQAKFQPVKHIKKILFAPWHPHGNGYIMPQGRDLNAHVYYNLLKIPGVELTVRHARTLYQNGLGDPIPNVIYQPSDMTLEGAVRAIDEADVVVTNANGTLGCMAIARGKPVVMYGQDVRPHDGYSDEMLKYVQSWELYRDMLTYPYDISATKERATQNIIQAAAQKEATSWRKEFIGKPLDGGKFAAMLDRLWRENDGR